MQKAGEGPFCVVQFRKGQQLHFQFNRLLHLLLVVHRVCTVQDFFFFFTCPPAPSVLNRYLMGWSVKVAADWMVVIAAGSSAVATEPKGRMTRNLKTTKFK